MSDTEPFLNLNMTCDHLLISVRIIQEEDAEYLFDHLSYNAQNKPLSQIHCESGFMQKCDRQRSS